MQGTAGTWWTRRRTVAAFVAVIAAFAGPTLVAAEVAAGPDAGAQQAGAQQAGLRPAGSRPAAVEWVPSWDTAMAPADPTGPSAVGFADQTVRQVVHLTLGGPRVRIRLANTYGSASLQVGAVTVARRTEPGEAHQVTVDGATAATIPPGASVVSDSVDLPVASGSDLVVDLYLPEPTGATTWHSDARSTSYVATGDRTGDPGSDGFSPVASWFFLDGVDVRSPGARLVVTLGDSITDGTKSTVDANHRWPDYAYDALRRSHQKGIAVANAAISGDRLLLDGLIPSYGQNALARLDRDVLAQPGVRAVVVYLGINDIQLDPSQLEPERIADAYRQLIRRGHDHGLRVVGGTLTPFHGFRLWSPEREATRLAVNEWIRTSDEFDGVLDFDAAVRDPQAPDTLRAAYDSADHLHPNDAGYQAMAGIVDLRQLVR